MLSVRRSLPIPLVGILALTFVGAIPASARSQTTTSRAPAANCCGIITGDGRMSIILASQVVHAQRSTVSRPVPGLSQDRRATRRGKVVISGAFALIASAPSPAVLSARLHS